MTTKRQFANAGSSLLGWPWPFLRLRSLGVRAGLFALGVTIFYEGLAMALLGLVFLAQDKH